VNYISEKNQSKCIKKNSFGKKKEEKKMCSSYINVAVATLANEKLLERASDNDLLLCRKSTSNKTCYRQ
jgi:hypothetical protein